jgi:ribosome biogenesis GTPase A
MMEETHSPKICVQINPLNDSIMQSEDLQLTEDEKRQERETGILDFKSVMHLLRQANEAIGNKKFKKGTLFVGDSKQGKSTIVNLMMGHQLISVYDEDVGQFDVRQIIT